MSIRLSIMLYMTIDKILAGTRCEYSQRLILNGNHCMYCFYMQGQQHADKFRYQPTNSDSYYTSRGHDLDTQAKKFPAHITIEAQWDLKSIDDDNKIFSSLSMDDQTRLNNGEIIKFSKDFPNNHWHPQLFLLNSGRDCNEKINCSIKRSAYRTQIRECRDVYENFYSKFNLHHFPTDIQDLSVSIVSALFDTEVILKVDLNRIFGINREAFTDQQEWKLYDHVEIQTKFIKGYLFQNDNDYELDTPGHERKRLILTMTCHAAFFALGGLYITINLVMAIWHYYVSAARRHHMEELDKLYRQLVDQRLCKDKLSAK
ncbi:unnamed protein product [Rotaria sp. Silwood1]|nr:unnamed protein product [Rotaria sp. Silwood1]